jgi:ABC-type nickel/cobalt efflux system permease component RcnA
MPRLALLLAALALLVLTAVSAPLLAADATEAPETAAVRIDPSKLIVRPKGDAALAIAPEPVLWREPLEWVKVKQRDFYDRMSGALRSIRGEHAASGALSLMLLSFAYGVLHAAGPGHGKAVVSAWLLANERELRRGVFIASLSAFFQALTAILIVSVLLATVTAAGSTARGVATVLQSASFGLIALLGFFMIWQGLQPSRLRAALAQGSSGRTHAHRHSHAGHEHGDHHAHDACGHRHVPTPAEVDGDWSLGKAISLAFAVGLRPCTGAILALLFSSAVGLYWAGIASTFVMALGTAITVSVIAVLAVTSRKLALRIAGRDSAWLARTATALRLVGGAIIAAFGSLLFLGSLGGTPGFS